MLIIEELKPYVKTITEFSVYVKDKLKLNPLDFYTKASNSVMIPHLIVFIESKDINFLDPLFYVNINTSGSLNYNELVKKTIRTVFFMLENNLPLDFLPF